MSGIYYTDALDVLRAAGLTVRENGTTNGWESRARSSGGFPAAPLCVFWHHTASSATPENDLAYMIDGSDDAPVGNMLIDRDGACWPIAAGASNCAGKGGPADFSRGTVPLDSGNTRGWQIEVANNGVGERWPVAQVNAFFAASNALNARFGNVPADVITHQGYAPSRKIDPATAAAVEGPWRPGSVTSSGTWSLPDVRAECGARAGTGPGPIPIPPGGDDDVEKYLVRDVDGWPWVTDFASYATSITEDQASDGVNMRGYIKGSDNEPFPLSQSDTDLMHRIAGQ